MSPLTSVSGLASGIDFQSLADAIMESRRAPIRKLESRIATNEARSEVYVSLESRLESLRSTSRSLQSATALLGNEARVSVTGGGDAPLTASARATSAVGSFDVEVLALAAPERLGGGTFASRTDALGLEGTFSLNGVEISVQGSDTLDDVVSRINQANREGPGGEDASGVRATVVTVAEGDVRLVLSSEREGAAGIAMDDPAGVLAGLGVLGAGGEKAEVLQAGADARIRVDGIELTRDSNRITDALDGITLNLETAAPGVVARIDVSSNNTMLQTTLGQLVEEFNDFVEYLDGAMKAGGEESRRGPLASDSVLRSVRRSLQATMLAIVPGAGADAPERLSDIGITLQRDGRFQLDEARLSEALASDRDGVARLLERSWESSHSALSLVNIGLNTAAGSYQVEVTEAATRARAESDVVQNPFGGTEGSQVSILNVNGTGALSVELTDGMTVDELAGQLNEALRAANRSVSVEVVDGRLSFEQDSYGSARGFELQMEGDAGTWLAGLQGGTHTGTDVVGTIDGQAAIGAGRQLTATVEGPAQGLVLLTDGVTDGEATFSFQRGVAAQLNDQVRRLTSVGDDASLNAIRQRMDAGNDRLRARANVIEGRLERQRAEMNRRFAAVEQAIAAAQNQTGSLQAQLQQINNFQWGPRKR